MQQYQFTMTITVTDEQALYDAAHHRWFEENPSDTDPDEFLKPDDEIDVSACIQMLADPGISWDGTNIEESSCEYLQCPGS